MGIHLKLTSAIAINGNIAKAGDVVEVSEADAKSLLHRGKAVLAQIDQEQLADAVEVPEGEEVPEQSEQPAEGETGETPEQPAETPEQATEAPEQPAEAPAAPAKAKGGKKAK